MWVPVSVYRVGAVGADPSYLFGGEAHDRDLRHAAWLGWLPLTLVEFAGPGVALVGDTWLTAPFGRSECPRRVVAGDVVTALDAAGELIARRESGLTTPPRSPPAAGSSSSAMSRSTGCGARAADDHGWEKNTGSHRPHRSPDDPRDGRRPRQRPEVDTPHDRQARRQASLHYSRRSRFDRQRA